MPLGEGAVLASAARTPPTCTSQLDKTSLDSNSPWEEWPVRKLGHGLVPVCELEGLFHVADPAAFSLTEKPGSRGHGARTEKTCQFALSSETSDAAPHLPVLPVGPEPPELHPRLGVYRLGPDGRRQNSGRWSETQLAITGSASHFGRALQSFKLDFKFRRRQVSSASESLP